MCKVTISIWRNPHGAYTKAAGAYTKCYIPIPQTKSTFPREHKLIFHWSSVIFIFCRTLANAAHDQLRVKGQPVHIAEVSKPYYDHKKSLIFSVCKKLKITRSLKGLCLCWFCRTQPTFVYQSSHSYNGNVQKIYVHLGNADFRRVF